MRILSLLALVALLSLTATAGTPVVRPNIVIILADDLGYADVGSYGSKEIATPHIDSIGRRGVRFTDGYVTAPQCSPSRVGLLTGRHQQRFGHETNLTMRAALDHGARLIPEYLKPAGYATALIGKWHLGETDPAHHPAKHGFDTVYDAKSAEAGATPDPRLRTQSYFERAAAYRAQQRAVNHQGSDLSKYVEGAILRYSFGYDMTINHYYQIVRAKGRSVVIRRIAAEVVNGDGGYSGTERPVKDAFLEGEPELTKRVTLNGVKVEHKHAYLWDGRPNYFNYLD